MRGRVFALDYIQLLYYKCPKINLNCGGPCIVFLDWIKNKKGTTDSSIQKITNVFKIF